MYLDNERRPTLTPQLAFRVAVIGGVALVMFALIFFRLWYLQVLSGDKYLAAASENRVREIKVQAPRGEIVDRHGQVLVENRASLSIKVAPDKLPENSGRARRGLPAAREAAQPEPAPTREAGRGRAEGGAVRQAHDQAGRPVAARGVRAGAPERVPGRRAGARVPARVPPRHCRRAPVRAGGRGQREAAEGPALQRCRRWATAWGRLGSRPNTTASSAAATGPRAWRWTRSATSPRR